MFEGKSWKNPFLNENYDKVCYILYLKIKIIQGLKVYYTKNFTSNLIDIEVIYTKNESISGRLLVEGDQLIDTLCNSIKDMLEIFPKLNGLDGLTVNNLRKKEGNNIIELIMGNPIKDHIKQEDKIYFDLTFNDIWIDVKMTLKDNDDENKTNKLSFELKVKLKNYKKELETSLVNLGITTWKLLKQQEQDYYLLTNVEIISEKESNLDMDNKKDDKYDFNDKIICTLTFINLTNYIYNITIEEIEQRNKIMKNIGYFENVQNEGIKKMNEIKEYFNNNIHNLYLNKAKNIKIIDKLLCKLSPEFKEDEEDVNIYPLLNSFNNSPNNSSIRYIGPFKKNEYKKDIEMDDINENSGLISFQNKVNIKNDSLIFSNSSISMKSFSGELLVKKDFQENNNELEEIEYIKNEINFDKLIDNFNPYLLISFNDSDSDLYRTRNLEFVEGELMNINKKNANKDNEKNNNKEHSTFINEEDYSYNNRLLRKYVAILVIIVFMIVLFKYIF